MTIQSIGNNNFHTQNIRGNSLSDSEKETKRAEMQAKMEEMKASGQTPQGGVGGPHQGVEGMPKGGMGEMPPEGDGKGKKPPMDKQQMKDAQNILSSNSTTTLESIYETDEEDDELSTVEELLEETETESETSELSTMEMLMEALEETDDEATATANTNSSDSNTISKETTSQFAVSNAISQYAQLNQQTTQAAAYSMQWTL
ncbi:hypothetical protein AN641_01880 [Candidatus Epulonipiscioides gigas]|nr:hypothetical protein AN641_01880 [Epulopiscium sp. SCG-C07WGA-EpuloA2]